MALVTNEDEGTQTEMLPCPWCGSTNLQATDDKRVHCKSCDALGPSPVDKKSFINQNDAIARWNARPDGGERIAKAISYINATDKACHLLIGAKIVGILNGTEG